MRGVQNISARMKASFIVGALGAFILFALLGGAVVLFGDSDYQLAAPAGTTEKSQ